MHLMSLKNQVDEHTLEVLEWPAIQEMLAAEAESPVGMELARSVRPLQTLEEARGVSDQIGEFRVLLSKETGLPFDRLFDIRESVRQIGRASCRERVYVLV